MSTPPAIVWFRGDLRLGDNPALLAAADRGGPVLPLFIHDAAGPPRALGAASRWWLDKSLRSLGADLRRLGARLILRSGDTREVLDEVIAESGAGAVYWNRLYDAGSVTRDAAIKTRLIAAGVNCRSFNAALLNEPWEITSAAGAPYRVFTPYWRAARNTAGDTPPSPPPRRLKGLLAGPPSEDLADWALHPTAPDWSSGFDDWTPGERGAQARVATFLGGAAHDYAKGRDRPGAAGTSRLSPHLRFGEIGPRQVWAASEAAAARGEVSHRQIEVFQRELGWREFNHHLLFHHPEITTRSFNRDFECFDRLGDEDGLEAWRRGRTGFPIVDAGLRQLWSTGWMHNRVRMIVASFLVKDLLVDWRDGESWFWDTLVDADVANNVANWQWVAGSGADAAPYFRIFNPTRQGETFDPEGDYVRRWAPELADLPNAFIHEPCRADAATLAKAGVTLGETYPAPIVNHAQARDRALAAYKRLS